MKTRKRSKMTVKRKRILPVLLTLFLLAGCGQQAPPSEYTVGAESLPALAVSENGEFLEETDPETEETSYTYSGLASGEKAAASYVSQLEEAGCSVINEEGEIQKDAGVSEEDGAVLLGRESEAGDGVVSLRITWDADSCTVTPFFQEELQLHEPQEEPEGGRELSMTQVTQLFQGFSPASLGLSGDSMEEYEIFPEEGYVMVDGEPCIRVNVYEQPAHSYAASYLAASDGSRFYRLDRAENRAEEITPEQG